MVASTLVLAAVLLAIPWPNRAVAIGMAEGPDAGLREIQEIEAEGSLASYHLLYSCKADFFRRAGRLKDALDEYGKATGDKWASDERIEEGVELSFLSCMLDSHDGLPTEPAALKKEALELAKVAATKREAKAVDVKVEHDDGPRDALQIETRAAVDGTLVLERWAISRRALALRCLDETGADEPANRKILDTALHSLRWTAGD